MTKAAERRTKLALERERIRLKDARLTLEDERRALGRERAEAITYLRLVCERYGDNAWDEDDTLLTILEDHLAIPLGARIAALLERLAALQQATRGVDRRPAVTGVQPRPAAPAAAGPPDRCDLTLRTLPTEGGRPGYQAHCRCGWRTAPCPSMIEAKLSGDRHLATPEPPAESRPPPTTRRRHA